MSIVTAAKARRMTAADPAWDPDGIGYNAIVRQISYSLFRHGKRLAGKSAAGLRGRCGGGGTGRAPGAETMTLR